MTQGKRVDDVVELERLLDDGEGDDALCAQAIKIHDRLVRDMNLAGRNQLDVQKRDQIKVQRADFRMVLDKIRQRRHAGVLSQYEAHLYRTKRKSP